MTEGYAENHNLAPSGVIEESRFLHAAHGDTETRCNVPQPSGNLQTGGCTEVSESQCTSKSSSKQCQCSEGKTDNLQTRYHTAVCSSTEAASCDGAPGKKHPHNLDEAQMKFLDAKLQKLMSAAELQEHLQLTNELHLQMIVSRLPLLEAVFQSQESTEKHKLLSIATTCTSPLLPPAIKPFTWPSDSPPHSTPSPMHRSTETVRCDSGIGMYDMDGRED